MSATFEVIRQAVNEAKELQCRVDRMSNDLADQLDGRLMHVSSWKLKKLKKQLESFNARTGAWKHEK